LSSATVSANFKLPPDHASPTSAHISLHAALRLIFQNKAKPRGFSATALENRRFFRRNQSKIHQNRFSTMAIYVIVFTVNSFPERAFMPPLPRPL